MEPPGDEDEHTSLPDHSPGENLECLVDIQGPNVGQSRFLVSRSRPSCHACRLGVLLHIITYPNRAELASPPAVRTSNRVSNAVPRERLFSKGPHFAQVSAQVAPAAALESLSRSSCSGRDSPDRCLGTVVEAAVRSVLSGLQVACQFQQALSDCSAAEIVIGRTVTHWD